MTAAHKRLLSDILSSERLDITPAPPRAAALLDLTSSKLAAVMYGADMPLHQSALHAALTRLTGCIPRAALAERALYLSRRLETQQASTERYIAERDTAQRDAEQNRQELQSLRNAAGIPREYSRACAERRMLEIKHAWGSLREAMYLDASASEDTVKQNLSAAFAVLKAHEALIDLRAAAARVRDLREKAGYILSQRVADDDVDLKSLYVNWESCGDEVREKYRRCAETLTIYGAMQAELIERARIEADPTRQRICINGITIIMPQGCSASHLCSVLGFVAVPQDDKSAALREKAARLVREVWVQWAQEQPDRAQHKSWLLSYDEITEREREIDRRIGDTLMSYGRLTAPAQSAVSDRKRFDTAAALREHEARSKNLDIKERFSLLYAARIIEEECGAQQVRRASGWVQPGGENEGRACFLALGTSETCINCGAHVSRHYDDHAKSKALHYFCVKQSKGITGRSRRSLRRLIKDLLKHLSGSLYSVWDLCIDDVISGGYAVTVLRTDNFQLSSKPPMIIGGDNRTLSWTNEAGVCGRLQVSSKESKQAALSAMLSEIASGKHKFA